MTSSWMCAIPGFFLLSPSQRGERETKPLSSLNLPGPGGLFQKLFYLGTQKKVLQVSSTPGSLDQSQFCRSLRTHLPVDKAIQGDPSGPYIQRLERNKFT